MTTTTRSQRAIASLAALVRETQLEAGVRPWDEAGTAAEVRRHPHVPLAALVWAFMRAAVDPSNETPAVLSLAEARAWQDSRPWRCDAHPRAARRIDGECGGCWADRNAAENPGVIRDRGGHSIPASARELVTAALRTRGGSM